MKCDNFASLAKNRIEIQKPVQTPDLYGGFITEWEKVGEYWAIVEPLVGKTIYQNDKQRSQFTHKITIRYLAALVDTDTAGKHRVLIGSQTMAVDAMANLAMDRKTLGRVFQALYCTEGGADNEAG